jgi:large subunit ribosomal protein L17
MFRNMVTSLFKNDRIKTTDTKAKEIRRWADQMITLAKRGDLHARRQALAIIREKKVVHKLFEIANDRWGARSGGYTRVVKIGRRPGDAAPMSLVELIVVEEDTQPKKKKSKKKSSAPAVAEKKTEKRLEEQADAEMPTAEKDTSADDETVAEVAQEDDQQAVKQEAAGISADKVDADLKSEGSSDPKESEEAGKAKE